MATTHKGECFCGAIHLEVSGEPEAMGYCNCRSCRSWSGGPVNAFTLWAPEAVKVVKGAEHVATYHKNGNEPSAVLSALWRSSDGCAPTAENGRCFRRDHSMPRVRTA